MEIKINIPNEKWRALGECSKKENLTTEEIVNKLITRYLLINTMDKMHKEAEPKLKDIGISNEEDILKMK